MYISELIDMSIKNNYKLPNCEQERNEKIAIIEDVITAGTAIRTVLPLLKEQADVDITALIISVDRMEKGKGELSAVQEVKKDFGINVYSIVTMEDIIEELMGNIFDEYDEEEIDYKKICPWNESIF